MPRYTNLDGTTPDKSLADILKWQIGDRLAGKRANRSPFVTPRRENDGAILASAAPHLTWIGHATFVMRLGGKLIATDPIWSERIGTFKRNTPPGVAFPQMPPIDVVTVSHSHRDHLDVPTLQRIGPKAVYVVPKDNADIFHDAGLPNVIELGWWEKTTVGELEITLVPAQHWSMRAPWDRNKRLWGGFVYKSHEGVAYHAGDTAFNARVFGEIAARAPKIDWAMIPIGAYEPEWFMGSQHIGPEDAGRAWDMLGAKNLVAMHWGTFQLTDEHLGEPPVRVKKWFDDQGRDRERLWLMDVGETRSLG